MKNKIFFSIFLWGVLSFSCTNSNEDKSEKHLNPKKEEQNDNSSDLEGKLIEMEPASELALEMKAIEKELQLLKASVDKGQEIDWKFLPENFIDATATDPNVKNGDFVSYTNAFHQRGLDFEQNPDKEHYEMVINACISCHEQFCTGPIKRIRKLYY